MEIGKRNWARLQFLGKIVDEVEFELRNLGAFTIFGKNCKHEIQRKPSNVGRGDGI